MPNMYGDYIKEPAGYCALHHFAMKVPDIKKRGCLDKHCKHFRRCPHKWWEQRTEQRRLRAERKRRIKTAVGSMGTRNA